MTVLLLTVDQTPAAVGVNLLIKSPCFVRSCRALCRFFSYIFIHYTLSFFAAVIIGLRDLDGSSFITSLTTYSYLL